MLNNIMKWLGLSAGTLAWVYANGMCAYLISMYTIRRHVMASKDKYKKFD